MTRRKLLESLPHGSGIDSYWEVQKHKKKFVAYNSYHLMNDVGYYIGWVNFSVHIPKGDPLSLKLHFHGKQSQNFARYYQLRDYLEDTIYWSLRENLEGKQWN